MAGLGAGWGAWGGKFQKAPQTAINKPQEPIDTGPSNPPTPTAAAAPKPKPRRMGGGINVGRTSNMGILPSPDDPFRTYGTVEGGRMTPPANPYGQNQPIRFTPGGEYGPTPPMMPPGINTGPSQMPPWFQPPTGGFTGGQMPPPIGSETGGMMGGGMFPPGRPQRQPFGGGRMGGGFSGMYR